MARDSDPGPSTRRIVIRAAVLVAPLVASAMAAPGVLGYFRARNEAHARTEAGFRPPTDEEIEAAAKAARNLAKAERGWQRITVITPQDGRSDASGETVRRFQGFGVAVESAPEGARVLVNGADKGETPLVASVACAPGDAVEIEVKKPPLPAQRRVTVCRADALVELSIDLTGDRGRNATRDAQRGGLRR
jgi:hypothetical protein